MTSWMWTWDISRPGIGEVGVYEKHSSKFDSFASIFQPCYLGLQESLNHPTWTKFLSFGSWILFLPFKELWHKRKKTQKGSPAIAKFFFELCTCSNFNIFLWVIKIASTWDQRRLESWGRDTSQRCSMFKPGRITGRPAALGHPEIIRNDWEWLW